MTEDPVRPSFAEVEVRVKSLTDIDGNEVSGSVELREVDPRGFGTIEGPDGPRVHQLNQGNSVTVKAWKLRGGYFSFNEGTTGLTNLRALEHCRFNGAIVRSASMHPSACVRWEFYPPRGFYCYMLHIPGHPPKPLDFRWDQQGDEWEVLDTDQIKFLTDGYGLPPALEDTTQEVAS